MPLAMAPSGEGCQLAHPREVGPALGIEQLLERLIEQDRQDDLEVQLGLEMRFGWSGCASQAEGGPPGIVIA